MAGDKVDWASLGSSSGSAEAVPGLLRLLRSAELDTRMDAADDLSWLLAAQGTIYEAAAYAVPVLLQQVGDRRAPGRISAFSLLSDLVCGDEAAWFAGRPDIAELRALVTRLGAMTEDDYQRLQQEKAAAAPDERTRQRAQRAARVGLEPHLSGLRWRLSSIDAVRAGIPLFVETLRDDGLYLRVWGAKMLSWFGDEEPDHTVVTAALLELLGREREEWVLATACMAAGMTGRPGDTALIEAVRGMLTHPEPPVWAAAAMAYAWLVPQPGRAVIEAIYDCLFEGPEECDFPFLDGDMTAMAATTLARLGPENADDRVAALVVRWAVADPSRDEVFAQAVLAAAFPRGPLPDGTAFAALDPAARAAVEAFRTRGHADRSAAWAMLRRYNLPGTKDGLDNWCEG
jgi:hypothetical protein